MRSIMAVVWLALGATLAISGQGAAPDLLGEDGFRQSLLPWYLLGPHELKVGEAPHGASGKALRIRLDPKQGANPWSVGLYRPVPHRIEPKQLLEIRFWARGTSGTALTVGIGLANTPWTSAFSMTFELTSKWREIVTRGYSGSGYGEAESRMVFHLAHGKGIVELADVRLRPVQPEEVYGFFDGVDEASRPVMARARARIEQVRKGDFVLGLVDERGNPVDGIADIALIEHEFSFGCNLFNAMGARWAEAWREEGLEIIDDLFNTVRVGVWWTHQQDQKQGEMNWWMSDPSIRWGREHGKRMRLHWLFYFKPDTLPKWHREVTSTEEWWQLFDRYVAGIAERYGAHVMEYDVLVEAVLWRERTRRLFPLLPDVSDPAVAARLFKLVDRHLAEAELVSLETGLLTLSRSNTYYRDCHQYRKELIRHGAPMDVIGYSGHFWPGENQPFQEGSPYGGPGAFTMAEIEKGIDDLARLGKPIHITEFTPPSRTKGGGPNEPRLSDREIAAWAVNFMTLAFSKPSVEQISFWSLADDMGGGGKDAGLLTREGVKKPLYHAVRKLLKETWTSEFRGEQREGTVRFRGFHGTYRVRVPGYADATVRLSSADPGRQHVAMLPR